ncbi:hypothetical protein GP486_005662 [Trichoglossum hirsutum]|uniref:Uncharacterized protein n=1 Tax=Trichoglossum hirsutum TaxID=265104 RepID=A0A9P8L8W7_9PEZI|nr:hypothetical protein GP486_005662 [Trichoglossum hirsutum]
MREGHMSEHAIPIVTSSVESDAELNAKQVATALSRLRRKPAIAAKNPDMSPATAPMRVLALMVSVTAVVAVLNATNVARKDILLATALLLPAVVDMGGIIKATAVVMVEDAVPVKTATPAVVLDTWPEIAPKAQGRNATTVGIRMS